MILIRSLRLEPGEDISALGPRAAKVLGCPAREIRELKLIKRSLDARKKTDIHYVCSVAVSLPGEEKYLERNRHIAPISPYEPPELSCPGWSRTSPRWWWASARRGCSPPWPWPGPGPGP